MTRKREILHPTSKTIEKKIMGPTDLSTSPLGGGGKVTKQIFLEALLRNMEDRKVISASTPYWDFL